jgi:branched-chain amino acid transport system ATP-binding protein
MSLDCDNLVAGYGKKEVLHGVSLSVPPGSVVSLIGPNGAGKTTTVLALTGFLPCRSGAVHLGDRDVTGWTTSRLIRAGVGVVPSGGRVFEDLTVLENLELGGYLLRGSSAVEAAVSRVCDLFPQLADRKKQHAGLLSGGERQMLAIGRALMLDPSCLVLDEPSLGLSPLAISAMLAGLQRLNAEHAMSILLVEQNVRAALDLSSRSYVMSLGRITEIIEDPDSNAVPDTLSRSFLGG